MIATLVRIGWINLRRDRAAQGLTFLLPILFFSIFASVFGNQGGDATSRIRVAVVDEDQTDASRRIIEALGKETALRLRTRTVIEGTVESGDLFDRVRAEALVKAGTAPVALVIPAGTGAQIAASGLGGATLVLLADPSDPIAPQMVQGLLQKAVMTHAPDLAIASGLEQFDQFIGMTPEQRKAIGGYVAQLKAGASTAGGAAAMSGIAVDVVNVVGGEGRTSDMVAFYAAGIGVMFLLFSCAAAGGSLLDEVESGTLERLIGSRLGMTGVLAGKWVFIVMMGFLQLTVMFIWGALVFGLDLWSHIPGFIVMSFFSAAAGASLGLVLATASRTRAQLSMLSTMVILTMSALGGSMFPRFLMSETMQKMGLVTFNAWALDGYLKVFWREQPLSALAPQVAVLSAATVVFMLIARTFARKWETV
ncbi:MAG: ABC transporter permease [Acidobacteriota bacterium]|nr:ABC transporter permease [Acidobacteriota bacterium]